VYPQRDDDITIPTITEAGAKLVMDAGQPALADDCFGRRDNEIQRAMECAYRYTATVEPRHPTVAAGVTL
jgi:hypothetical protein